MSYQVLARKWRPRNFSTLVGQEHVVRALTHALSEQRLHHAYLFTGTRGVGKTTIARILAKSLNCERGITATPCGVCSACTEIDSGRFVDLLEVDAATNTKVDEMRQLLENAVYAPTRGRFKVYVIDEVHMLSNSAFNAMLKTLEEPPEHVKFILATTDPQKIPVTVLSRCLQFNLKQMPNGLIAEHLAQILQSEGIQADSQALGLISRSASGSMRDALSLLDQAIAHGAGKVEESQVRSMLGTVDQDFLFDLLEALHEGNPDALLQIAANIGARSLSFSGALQDFASLLTRVQIAQCVPSALDDGEPQLKRLLALAADFSPAFIQLAYQIVLVGRQELPSAPDEYSGFVMTLLRLHTFRPSTTAELSPFRQPEAARVPYAPRKKSSEVLVEGVVADLKGAEGVAPTQSMGAKNDAGWSEIVSSLQLTGLARTLAQHCELRAVTERECVLRLPPTHSHLQMKPAPDRLQQALSEYFSRALLLRIELAETELETPAATADREKGERNSLAHASIAQDGFVRDVLDTFDAALIQSSIKPIS